MAKVAHTAKFVEAPVMTRRALLAVPALAALAGALGGCSQDGSKDAGSSAGSSQTSDEGRTLVVAMELAYPPFETKDGAGEPSGISVDFMRDFGEAYGYDIVIENTAWDGLIPSLQTGKADCVISSMTITDERKQTVDFSDAYAQAQLAILANSGSGISSVDDLNQEGKTVAVKTGSTGDVYATNHLTEATITRLADESACVTEVVQGRADGFIYDQLTIYRNHEANPDTTEAVFIPFQDPEEWGIAVKKGDTELLDELNAFIADSKDNGEFDRLTEKYLAEEKAAFDELGFTWFFDFE
ncbi:transporter substrate-binding domain-containing protein [Collinsella ihumii]|uniref:Transporter substrate-binding domain-containing protein n=1 Tax=Collinsella ihumii TaxID=1720204 RepID=A0AAW7JZD2_9ACTN|nr:transporter substrate-binding domain-containing protein [Collinsella ihumii]MCF6414231.1 transporter substrate-binding domain-containing protein [Collinsella tanakaei]MDN0056104.1 transporter substrate-binding domain-containing protein [Collinsella ihumii]MDN0069860.1 transporter substrate-binding domain-containing protein [Collinsella ihumii]